MSDQILIAIIGSGGVAAAINFISNLILRRMGKRDAIRAGMMVLLFDRIRFLGNAFIEDHEIDFDDRRNLHKMHDAYHNLGGNGDLDVLMAQVDRLPLKH